MRCTMYERAGDFLGLRERVGGADHPLIQYWHMLCGGDGDDHDEESWCSSAMNGIAFDCHLPRSRSKAARSWLNVGTPVDLADAIPCANDIAIFWRNSRDGWQGHVGVVCDIEGEMIRVRGGNQGDQFCDALYPIARLLGIRRLSAA